MRKNGKRRMLSVLLTLALSMSTFVSGGYAYEETPPLTEISESNVVQEFAQSDQPITEETTTDNAASDSEILPTEKPTELTTVSATVPPSGRENKYSLTISMGTKVSDTTVELGIGETYRCIPEGYSADKKYLWTSSNKRVVTVDENGYVTALQTGSASIVCKPDSGDTYICKLKVKEAPRTVSINASYLKMGVGERYQFSAYINKEATAYHKYFCSSSSLGMPVGSSSGLATALKPGRYSIVFMTYNNVRAKCSVVVKDAPTSVSFAKSSLTLAPGKTETLQHSFSAGSYSSQLCVSSDNESVAEAYLSSDNKVIVKTKEKGTATITLTTHNGKTAQCQIHVKEEVVSMSASATATSILKGNHAYIKTTVTPSDTPVSFSSSDSSVATVDENGIVTGKSGGSAVITARAGAITKTFTINVSYYSSDTYLPYSQYTLNNGKSLYLKSMGSTFSSSDTSVATVTSKGFVTAHKRGVAIITADYYGSKKTCALIVDGLAPVRFSYSSPNFASKNQKVTLIAITDMYRTSVRFNVNVNGTIHTVDATEKSLSTSGNRYIWKGYYTFSSAGEYPVTAYSMYQNNGSYATCSDGKSTVVVSDVTSSSEVSKLRRRGSEEMLAINATFEGYSDQVYDDPLVYDTPTTGYGHVVLTGEEFYNDMTKEEAFAFMVNDINDSIYTSSVNNFMERYDIKFNQQQFDALVLFVYNLGPGYLTSGAVSEALLNCWHNGERNLNYVNKTELQRSWVKLHHASNRCIWGLLYRRIDEVEMFCYGDYTLDGRSNKYGIPYTWNCYEYSP